MLVLLAVIAGMFTSLHSEIAFADDEIVSVSKEAEAPNAQPKSDQPSTATASVCSTTSWIKAYTSKHVSVYTDYEGCSNVTLKYSVSYSAGTHAKSGETTLNGDGRFKMADETWSDLENDAVITLNITVGDVSETITAVVKFKDPVFVAKKEQSNPCQFGFTGHTDPKLLVEAIVDGNVVFSKEEYRNTEDWELGPYDSPDYPEFNVRVRAFNSKGEVKADYMFDYTNPCHKPEYSVKITGNGDCNVWTTSAVASPEGANIVYSPAQNGSWKDNETSVTVTATATWPNGETRNSTVTINRPTNCQTPEQTPPFMHLGFQKTCYGTFVWVKEVHRGRSPFIQATDFGISAYDLSWGKDLKFPNGIFIPRWMSETGFRVHIGMVAESDSPSGVEYLKDFGFVTIPGFNPEDLANCQSNAMNCTGEITVNMPAPSVDYDNVKLIEDWLWNSSAEVSYFRGNPALGLETGSFKPVSIPWGNYVDGRPTWYAKTKDVYNGAGIYTLWGGKIVNSVSPWQSITLFRGESDNLPLCETTPEEKKEPMKVTVCVYYDNNKKEGVTREFTLPDEQEEYERAKAEEQERCRPPESIGDMHGGKTAVAHLNISGVADFDVVELGNGKFNTNVGAVHNNTGNVTVVSVHYAGYGKSLKNITSGTIITYETVEGVKSFKVTQVVVQSRSGEAYGNPASLAPANGLVLMSCEDMSATNTVYIIAEPID